MKRRRKCLIAVLFVVALIFTMLPQNLGQKIGVTEEVKAEDPQESTTQASPEGTTQAPEEEHTENSTETTESTEISDKLQLASIFESLKDEVVPGNCYEITDEGLIVYVAGEEGTPDVTGQAILDAIQRASDTTSPLAVIIKRYSNQEAFNSGEEPNKQLEISKGCYVISSIDAESTYSLEQIEQRLGNIYYARMVTITSHTNDNIYKVTKGFSYTFQLNLDEKTVRNGVRWSVADNESKKTSIDSTVGTLTVSSDETASMLKIIATLGGVGRYITVRVAESSTSDDTADDIGDDNEENEKTEKVYSIKLTGISKKIAAGKKIKLKATVLPKNATNKNLIWTSSNPNIATVTQSGKVMINSKAGGKSVIIKAHAIDGSEKYGAWKIKVMKGEVRKVAVKGAKKALKAGKTMKLKAVVKAAKGANKKLQWTSSNKKYVTVSSSGKVKALSAGKGKTVKITAMATDGTNKKKVVKIKIQ